MKPPPRRYRPSPREARTGRGLGRGFSTPGPWSIPQLPGVKARLEAAPRSGSGLNAQAVETLRFGPNRVGGQAGGIGRDDGSAQVSPRGLSQVRFELDLVGLAHGGAPSQGDAPLRLNDGLEAERRRHCHDAEGAGIGGDGVIAQKLVGVQQSNRNRIGSGGEATSAAQL